MKWFLRLFPIFVAAEREVRVLQKTNEELRKEVRNLRTQLFTADQHQLIVHSRASELVEKLEQHVPTPAK